MALAFTTNVFVRNVQQTSLRMKRSQFTQQHCRLVGHMTTENITQLTIIIQDIMASVNVNTFIDSFVHIPS